MKLGFITLFTSFFIFSFTSTIGAEPIDTHTDKFRLETYFLGKTKAWGIIENRFGKNKFTHFEVDITGSWDGKILTLEEDFLYSSGRTDRRVWKISKTGENTYSGTADDVIGVANGEILGNRFSWKYYMKLPIGKSVIKVKLDDKMWLQKNGVLINNAKIKKFGLKFADLTIFFIK
ncbi:MAG: hypothetical protein CFH01_00256 [Alphaproteobacteria bacterium MarineAlpha2_Bin1]|nr:MAG: hypothetical protein CFH01_00256 [Alphaproteobacteria bacterium MarineAlpha2_Bin1]